MMMSSLSHVRDTRKNNAKYTQFRKRKKKQKNEKPNIKSQKKKTLKEKISK